METTALQQQFETLVNQLEKMRSVNELTSTNAQSAKAAIGLVNNYNQQLEHLLGEFEKERHNANQKVSKIQKQAEDAIDESPPTTKIA